MKKFLLITFAFIIRFVLSLRYRVTFKGLDQLKKPKVRSGGYIILPNHPAEMDPIMMMVYLWRRFQMHPLVIEHFFHFPGARPFMKAVGAVPIPNFENTVNRWKVEKGEKAFDTVVELLKKQENLLIYPSGHLKGSGRDVITGSSFVYNLLREHPDANVLMVRISGLWGSSFSRAFTGKTPNFWNVLLRGAWTLLKNGIFFAPRRKVVIELYNPGNDFPYDAPKFEQNLFLQSWYNRYQDENGKEIDHEPLNLVSYSFFRKDLPKHIAALEHKAKPVGDVKISSQMERMILDKIAEMTEKSNNEISPEQDLSVDLGLDSLDIANLYAYVTEEFDVMSKVEPGELRTVRDLFELAIDEKRSERHQDSDGKKKKGWPEEKDRKDPAPPAGKTIMEAFLNSCDRMGGAIAGADAISGVMTYQRMKLAILVLSGQIKKMPGQYVGIMLPSSMGVYIMILATLMAGKIPVMLNWTAGIRSLRYAVDLLKIEAILSSRKFLDRMDHLQLEELEEKLVLAEVIRKKISVVDKLKGALKSKKSTESLLRSMKLDEISSRNPAVVLFTSGTEAYPKAVPLSHENILYNQHATLGALPLYYTDTLYGVLPPFHSFGFSVTGLLPLLSGMRVFYAPDPTDGQAIAHDVAQWDITMMCLAPSFYKNLLRMASKEQLKTLRLYVSGAEKASDDLQAAIARLGTDPEFVEGYGITECSPVVSISRPSLKSNRGVGRPIPNVSLMVINVDTHQPMPAGGEGEVCIAGPNVFYGYLGDVKRDPFITIDGKKWYRSGDIGKVDQEGNLILGGRLKRFVKIGGEMVSLASIEEELIDKSVEKGWAKEREEAENAFVLCAKEVTDGRPYMVLFTTFSVKKEEINQLLRDSGFGRIVKVSEVCQLHEIPLLGSGKVNYRKLNDMVVV